jgi:hypothetical protein
VVVWKFPLRPWSAFIDMPADARILYVGHDGTDACVWALCDPNRPKKPRYVAAIPTGDEVPRPAVTYVGTFMVDEGAGPLVFHVFEGPAVERDGVITTPAEEVADAV